MKIAALTIATLIICIFVPNLIWLGYSTARITNGGTDTLITVVVHVDEKETNLGDLPPGKSRFIILPKSGDAGYRISYEIRAHSKSACGEYVEGEMYHVETILESSQGSKCMVSITPLISDLFTLKMISGSAI